MSHCAWLEVAVAEIWCRIDCAAGYAGWCVEVWHAGKSRMSSIKNARSSYSSVLGGKNWTLACRRGDAMGLGEMYPRATRSVAVNFPCPALAFLLLRGLTLFAPSILASAAGKPPLLQISCAGMFSVTPRPRSVVVVEYVVGARGGRADPEATGPSSPAP